jgi:hypothetical protein
MYVAILFTIATTSSVTIIPVLYWLFAGLLSGLLRTRHSTKAVPTIRDAVAGAWLDPEPQTSQAPAGVRILGRGI